MIDKNDIERVKSAADLVAIIGRYVELRRNGSRFVACCPFHSERTGSFYVTPPNQRFPFGAYKCYGCGKGGNDAISFIQEAEGVGFIDAVKIVASLSGGYLAENNDNKANELKNNTMTPPLLRQTSAKCPPKHPKYLSYGSVEASAKLVDKSNLFIYLVAKFPKHEDVIRKTFWAYRVGFSAKERINGCSACSTFPSIDVSGNVHKIKIIPFPGNDHHRIKDKVSVRPFDMRTIQGENVEGCYFGSHLVSERPNDPVALVESEKTALVASIFYPQFVWVATQGKGYLDKKRAEFLKGRVLLLFPDRDALEDSEKGKGWVTRAEELRAAGHSVLIVDDLLKRCPATSTTDICDIIISTFQDAEPEPPKRVLTPKEEAIQVFEEMKRNNPLLAEFAATFQLEPISIEHFEPVCGAEPNPRPKR